MAYFSDNFDRANGGLGSNWTTINSYAAPQIVSSQASYTSDYTFAKAVYNGASFSSKQYAEFATYNTTDGTCDVIIAASGYSNSSIFCCYFLRLYYYFQSWQIYRVDNGTETLIAGGSGSGTSTTISNGDVFRLALNSGVLTAYRNGTSIGSVSDSTYSSGYCGISIYRIGTSAVDNFVASDIVTATSATTDGADTSSASLNAKTTATSTTTDGADSSAATATVTGIIVATSAKTDGADISLCTVVGGVIVTLNSATTDGADVSFTGALLTGWINIQTIQTPIWSGITSMQGSNWIIITSAQNPTWNTIVTQDNAVGGYSQTTDGRDVSVSKLAVGLGATSATTDGADTSVASATINAVRYATSATTDGADTSSASATVTGVTTGFTYPRIGAYAIGGGNYASDPWKEFAKHIDVAIINPIGPYDGNGNSIATAITEIKTANPTIKFVQYCDVVLMYPGVFTSSDFNPTALANNWMLRTSWPYGDLVLSQPGNPGTYICEPYPGGAVGTTGTAVGLTSNQYAVRWINSAELTANVGGYAPNFNVGFDLKSLVDAVYFDDIPANVRSPGDVTRGQPLPSGASNNDQLVQLGVIDLKNQFLAYIGKEFWNNSGMLGNAGAYVCPPYFYNLSLGGVQEGIDFAYQYGGTSVSLNFYTEVNKQIIQNAMRVYYYVFPDGSTPVLTPGTPIGTPLTTIDIPAGEGVKFWFCEYLCFTNDGGSFHATPGYGYGTNFYTSNDFVWHDIYSVDRNTGLPYTYPNVDAGRHYLGAAVDGPQMSTPQANGTYRRQFTYGWAVYNPQGNGPQSVTFPQDVRIVGPGTYVNAGSQITVGDKRGLIVVKASGGGSITGSITYPKFGQSLTATDFAPEYVRDIIAQVSKLVLLGAPWDQTFTGAPFTRQSLYTSIKTKAAANGLDLKIVQYDDFNEINPDYPNSGTPPAHQKFLDACFRNNWWLYVTTNYNPSSGVVARSTYNNNWYLTNMSHFVTTDTATGLYPYQYAALVEYQAFVTGETGGPGNTTTQIDGYCVDNLFRYAKCSNPFGAGNTDRGPNIDRGLSATTDGGYYNSSNPFLPNGPAQKFREGEADYATQLRKYVPSAKVGGNIGYDLWNAIKYIDIEGNPYRDDAGYTGWPGQFDFGTMEACLGGWDPNPVTHPWPDVNGGYRDISYESESGTNVWIKTAARCSEIMLPGTWFSCQHVLDDFDGTDRWSSTPYQAVRYGLGICSMINMCVWVPDNYPRYGTVDQYTYIFDEMYGGALQNPNWLGDPIDPPQTVPWSGNVYRRRFQNGAVFVNAKNGTSTPSGYFITEAPQTIKLGTAGYADHGYIYQRLTAHYPGYTAENGQLDPSNPSQPLLPTPTTYQNQTINNGSQDNFVLQPGDGLFVVRV